MAQHDIAGLRRNIGSFRNPADILGVAAAPPYFFFVMKGDVYRKYQINIRLPPRVYRTPHDADMLYICRAAAKLFSYQRLYGFLHRHAGADIHYP